MVLSIFLPTRTGTSASTRDDGTPATLTNLVFVPEHLYGSDGPMRTVRAPFSDDYSTVLKDRLNKARKDTTKWKLA